MGSSIKTQPEKNSVGCYELGFVIEFDCILFHKLLIFYNIMHNAFIWEGVEPYTHSRYAHDRYILYSLSSGVSPRSFIKERKHSESDGEEWRRVRSWRGVEEIGSWVLQTEWSL